MKKILLTSTALILMGGAAAAQVSVSGDGRMGVVYQSWQDSGERFSFNSRLRITFTAQGQTDGGLNFGGSIRADNASGGASGTAGHVYISGEFGRISMGDVDGAAEHVIGDLHMTSLTGLDVLGLGFIDAGETIFISNLDAVQRPTMRYDYTMGDFAFALSADNPGSGITDHLYSLGVAYDAGMFGVAVGYERAKVDVLGGTTFNHALIAGTASVDGVADFKAIYGRLSSSALPFSPKQYGLSAETTFDATTVSAYVRRVKLDSERIDGFGIGASYDLGGGAALVGGVSRINPSFASSETAADFGVSMRF